MGFGGPRAPLFFEGETMRYLGRGLYVDDDGRAMTKQEVAAAKTREAAAAEPPVAAAKAVEAEDELLDLLDNTVLDIVGQLDGMPIEDMQRLLGAERNGKTRKTLVQELEARILARTAPRPPQG